MTRTRACMHACTAMTMLLIVAACQEDKASSRAQAQPDTTPPPSVDPTPGPADDTLDAQPVVETPSQTPEKDEAAADDDGPEGKADKSADLSPMVKAKPVVITGSRQDDMPGYIWKPALAKGKKAPAVLLMYGISGDKDDAGIHSAADILAANGYVVLTFDWPGTGDRGMISNRDRITDTDWRDWTVADYKVALSYLAQQPEVDASRLGYIGASMGAMTGLILAVEDQRVKVMAAIVPVDNPLWGAKQPDRTIGAIAPRPVLCISTEGDGSAGVCDRVGTNGEKKNIPGGHENLDPVQVAQVVRAFFEKHMKP